jgi:hypothetical protein
MVDFWMCGRWIGSVAAQLHGLDDVHDLSADALLGLDRRSADMSGRFKNVPAAHF